MILFHHIPKTAGSTFHKILDNAYSADKIFSINGLDPEKSIQEFASLEQDERNNFDVVKGHLADKLEPYISIKPLDKIIFLRDPIEHTISSFFYLKRASWNKSYERVKKIRKLEDFINYRTREGLNDLQLRHLTGQTEFLLTGIKSDQTVDAALLEKGKQILLEARFVFLTDYFDYSVLTLKKQLKWKYNPWYLTNNKTNNRPSKQNFSDNEIDLIKSFNRYDLELYKYARQLFMQKYDYKSDKSLMTQVRRFRRINNLRNFLQLNS
ncbi:MAG: sulfotransferase family 2 domain-containing protein [Bacteroidota bacterium]